MRLEIEDKICSCSCCSIHSEKKNIVEFDTKFGTYRVNFVTAEKAKEIYNQMLISGYCSANGYSCKNHF